MKILYNIYQICFALPVLLVLTVLTALVTIIGSLLGALISGDIIRVNMVTTDLLPAAHSGKDKRTRETSQTYFLCVCPKPSGFFRYFPDLRLLGQKLQMDDEEKPSKNSVRRQSMRKRGTYLRRPFQS